MKNLFDILPSQFFNLFHGANKRVIADCLYLVYDSFKNDLAFSCTRNEMVRVFEDYFDSHIVEIESDEKLSNSHERAMWVLRRLKECGWINEEVGASYEIEVSFEDFSIPIMEALFTLNDTKETGEYSHLVYNIYSLFKNFDLNKGDLIIETAYIQTKDLVSKLKTLNANIKKYIQKLLDDSIKDDLNALLEALLQDFQVKIVDRAYYNLTTYDHPAKYRHEIIHCIETFLANEDYMSLMVSNRQMRSDLSKQEALLSIESQSDYVLNAFYHIEDIMNEIDEKHRRFIQSACNRIIFLLNHKKDMEGKINHILKCYAKGYEQEGLANIYLNQWFNQESLYVPKTLKKQVQSSVLERFNLNQEKKDQVLSALFQKQRHNRKEIEKKVMVLLENGPFLGSSLALNDQDDLIFLVLVYLYGFNRLVKYEIEPLDEISHVGGYRFRNFIVKRRSNREL